MVWKQEANLDDLKGVAVCFSKILWRNNCHNIVCCHSCRHSSKKADIFRISTALNSSILCEFRLRILVPSRERKNQIKKMEVAMKWWSQVISRLWYHINIWGQAWDCKYLRKQSGTQAFHEEIQRTRRIEKKRMICYFIILIEWSEYICVYLYIQGEERRRENDVVVHNRSLPKITSS